MANRLLALIPVVMAMILVATPRRAEACSCVMPPPPKAALEAASAVFEGKIVKIDRNPDKHQVMATFAVTRWWKGGETAQTRVATIDAGSMCGLSFADAEQWLVYADGPADGLSAGMCSRTRRSAEAGDDRKALGAGKPPNPALPSPVPAAEPEPAPAEPAPVSAPAPVVAPAPAPAAPAAPPSTEAQGCTLAPQRGAGLLGVVVIAGLLGRRRARRG